MANYACINWAEVGRVLSALLTPLIAVLTGYIAIQQYRINRAEFRLALRDRRMKVFESTMELIGTVLRKARVETDDLNKFLVGTSDGEFLFESDITGYLTAVYDKAVELYALTDASDEDRREKWKITIEWFVSQTGEAKKKFTKYLAFNKG